MSDILTRIGNVLKRATSVRAATQTWLATVSAAGIAGGWPSAKPIAIWGGLTVVYQILEKVVADDCQEEPPRLPSRLAPPFSGLGSSPGRREG